MARHILSAIFSHKKGRPIYTHIFLAILRVLVWYSTHVSFFVFSNGMISSSSRFTKTHRDVHQKIRLSLCQFRGFNCHAKCTARLTTNLTTPIPILSVFSPISESDVEAVFR